MFLAKRKKKKTGALEIIIAIIVVIFILSMIGISTKSGETFAGKFSNPVAEKTQITTVVTVEESSTSTSGTQLSSASSSFEVMPK